jgi:hypothetical protein
MRNLIDRIRWHWNDLLDFPFSVGELFVCGLLSALIATVATYFAMRG